MRNEKGFTLIELVVVIVVLGILAAIAVPKFIDIQADARLSTVGGMTGALQGASALGHAQGLVDGVVNGTVDMEGNVTLVNGYPAGTAAGIGAALNLSGFTPTYAAGPPAVATFTPNSGGGAGCVVTYTEATIAGTTITPPVINNTATLANCQ